MKRFMCLVLALLLPISALPAFAETLPELPLSAELYERDFTLPAGQKLAVYSAPDAASLRGANGMAALSTNGAVRVLGREGNWLLVEYAIDAEHDRVGYVDASLYPQAAEVAPLRFSSLTATAKRDAEVTDDPLLSHAKLTTLKAGERVTWLGTLGEWAYVAGKNWRGFVPVSSLKLDETASDFTAYPAEEGEDYTMFEVLKLHYDENHQVYAVVGQYERIGMDDDCYCPEYTEEIFTYPLAEGFQAAMINSMYLPENEDEWLLLQPTVDLYRWWIAACLPDAPLDTVLRFDYDYPELEWDERDTNFWFFTTRIVLNDAGEIVYMEYEYVPWG
ncbi:MAG: hypothetical protein IJS53_01440 [Clostridia bacterium]|nr:hypothetical protein [Clostridia bacterium]